ncbi:hypothetical protein [Candidatus Poriferisodalis sp.]|uniref:hypothetical protein n=1 Tax=Candidatus Poriferisodalis sp. TaxID=3101277 RepID=UPI003AF47D13
MSEARTNYKAYQEKYQDDLEQTDLGRIALMYNGEVVGLFNDDEDAYSVGLDRYGSGKFSMQRIGAQPISMGLLTALT